MKNLRRYLNNQKGFSFIELLVVMVIGVFLMSAAIITFTHHQSVIKDETDTTHVRAGGRIGLELLARVLRGAGSGFPSGQGVTSADDETLTIRSNTDNVVAWATSNIVGGTSTSFTVRTGGAANFAANDKITIINTNDDSVWETAVVQSVNVGTDTITVTAALTNSYFTSSPNIVNKYHDVVFALDNGNNRITKTVDGGTAVMVVGEVATGGLDFNYFDNTNTEITVMPVVTPANIRKIEITLNLQDTENPDAAVTLETDVNLRNMGS